MENKVSDNKTKKKTIGEIIQNIISNIIKFKFPFLIAAAVLAFAFIFIINPFHFKIGFAKRKLEIEKTNNIVTEIKKIAEFTTACFYEELIIQDIKYKYKKRNIYQNSDNWFERLTGQNKELIDIAVDSTEIGKIVLIAKGKIRAGLNFSKLTKNDFKIRHDTLYAYLPSAEIFDVIINPSDIEFFHRSGNYWDEEGIAALVSKGKASMYEHAMTENIIEKANKYGIEKMTNIFKTFGFKEAVVSIKETEADFNLEDNKLIKN